MQHRVFISKRTAVAGLLAAVVWGGIITSGSADERTFLNPYARVNWARVDHYYANLHTHTVYSDGDFTPHDAIDAYHELGYQILALTDHDNDYYPARPKILYPWTELDSIHNEIKDKPNTSWRWQNKPYGEISEYWEPRDPEALNMISVPGSEISFTHHIVSLFNDYPGYTHSEETALTEIGKRGGLSIFAHPGRYDPYPAWYIYFYERHDHLIGLEVYNQRDRHPGDRALWDRLLHMMMPDRPIWGVPSDDMHRTEHMGWNYKIFPLEALSKTAVRTALESGAFYFYKPNEQKTSPTLHITRIDVAENRIRLGGDGDVDVIQWITHNPDTGESEVIHKGPQLTMADIPMSATFVRARIVGPEGAAYTQPFGIWTGIPRERPGIPPGELQELDGWNRYQDRDAELVLDSVEGKSGNALKISYDLADGDWVSVLKSVGSIEEDSVIRFEIRGEGRGNTIELKMEDGSGATWGQTLPMKTEADSWYGMEIPVTDLTYWWGGEEGAPMNLSRVGLSFAIVEKWGDPGGAGTLYLDNISIR